MVTRFLQTIFPAHFDDAKSTRAMPVRRRQSLFNFEVLEPRQLLAASLIAPVGAGLQSVGGSYLEYGVNGSHWYDGSGLSDASIVETGDPIPATWPEHVSGNHSDRVSRIRNSAEVNTLTFDLGGTFDITGMVLWNSTENGSQEVQTDRGFENTVLSYSTDGGLTFTGSDTLTWTERTADASVNQGANPTPPVAMFGPEVQLLPSTVAGVTHIRMDVDNFSGEAIVMAAEIRFLGETDLVSGAVADLSVKTANGQLDLTQGKEAGTTAIELNVTLDRPNVSGSAISFDLDDLGSGTATAGVDYVALPAGAKITVPTGQQTGTLLVDVFDDFLIEATETVNFRITNPSEPTVAINTANVTATIADNDNAGVTIAGAENLKISEAGNTDTYTIALDTIPTGAVEITATADTQTQLSIDGINFASTQVLRLTDRTPQTITVRAVDDSTIENIHRGTITHAITGVVVDPSYPDVTVESLYTQTGTDPTFQELIDSGALPTGSNSTAGIKGSTIDVNNSVVEQGIHANTPIRQNINIHTLANSSISRNFFDRWTRWYQEDGNTQIFRVFEGEENVRNTRALAARVESFSNGWQTGVWNDFSARYTIVKPESMAIFQSFQSGVEWSVHIGMEADGGINFTHRRANGGGSLKIPLAEDMVGKSFDIRIRENGLDYEVYFNGELKGRGQYEKPDNAFQFRWGTYRGSRPMTRDSLIFVTGASIQANTSAPVGLVPYRPATTSLSIASVTAEIVDNDDDQAATVTSVVINEGGVLARPDLWSSLSVTFSANVNVSPSDLSLVNDTLGGTAVAVPLSSFNYDHSTYTATWNFDSSQPRALEAAFYTLVLNASTITSVAAGVALDGDHNGSAGGNYIQSHYVAIPGDANLDGDVDASEPVGFDNVGDLFRVRPAVGTPSGATWASGDFNADGDVDGSQPVGFGNVGDLFVLLENLGRNVRPTASPAIVSLVLTPTTTKNETPIVTAEFSDREIITPAIAPTITLPQSVTDHDQPVALLESKKQTESSRIDSIDCASESTVASQPTPLVIVAPMVVPEKTIPTNNRVQNPNERSLARDHGSQSWEHAMRCKPSNSVDDLPRFESRTESLRITGQQTGKTPAWVTTAEQLDETFATLDIELESMLRWI